MARWASEARSGWSFLLRTRSQHHRAGPCNKVPHAVGTLIDRAALDRHTMHEVLAAAGCVPASVERQMRAAPCPPAIAKALGLRPLAPTFHVERIARDGHGTPLHFLSGHWRWDRFSMRLFSDGGAGAGTVRIDEAEPEEEHDFGPVAS